MTATFDPGLPKEKHILDLPEPIRTLKEKRFLA
jgi:hypothetical protein